MKVAILSLSDKDMMICLLCDTTISKVVKYNAHQHYSTHKYHKYANQEGESRKIAWEKLKAENKNKNNYSNQCYIREVIPLKQVINGKKDKLFSEPEIIKDCIISKL